MIKLDIKKELQHLYKPSIKHPELVDVPNMNFLMVDGKGDPNTTPEFQDAVEALYSLSYTLKFMVKKGPSLIDYKVMPLEGLWWSEDMWEFSVEHKDDWLWTLMIMQPEFVTDDLFTKALFQVQKKKDLPALPRVRLESYHEGLSVQIMHVGPFSDEGPTVAKLHGFIEDEKHERAGKHHEIYLSDPRKASPDKMKTVIRQPVRAK
ncbi:MAG: GyrI-like domain-containing protein [Clostridiales bacterium]|jgi:hypothetical protein|nr:GyrI-like domain-containing protein [Clostridiales bacterium]